MFGFSKTASLLPPKLTNNPSLDVIVTETTPMLTFFNSPNHQQNCHYEIELDTTADFNSANLIKYQHVLSTNDFITSQKILAKDALLDQKKYFWRARTVLGHQKSAWATSRFFVDEPSDDHFMNLIRVPVRKIAVSAGYNAKNIIDWDDPGLLTFWQSPPPGERESWVMLDLGKETEICKAWILSNFTEADNWLKDFVLQKSSDGKHWIDIKGTDIKNNDTFRNILDFAPVKTRYVRVLIKDFLGYAAQINEIILYSKGMPDLPKIPKEDYVLIIGNEHNGFTFTDLAGHLESLNLGLKTVTVPYYEASLEMLEKLSKKPVAIILSGNNADYPNLPMFEHNGEFEIIRQSDIPILGICAGHQFLAMAYGYTRAASMGWSDITAINLQKKWTQTKILKEDPIFKGIADNFVAPEIHGWAVIEPGDEFEVIASSTYVQVQKSTRRLIYGEQFHAEINASYNHGRPFIKNFLEMALQQSI